MSYLLVLGSTPNIYLIVIASVEIFHLIVCSGRFACQVFLSFQVLLPIVRMMNQYYSRS
jgi:hypothetical protein